MLDNEATLAGAYSEASAYVDELIESGASQEEIDDAIKERRKVWQAYQVAMAGE